MLLFSTHLGFSQGTQGTAFNLKMTELIYNTSVTTPNYYQKYDSITVPVINICEDTYTLFEIVNGGGSSNFYLGISSSSTPWPLQGNSWTWLDSISSNTWLHQFQTPGEFFITYALVDQDSASGNNGPGNWEWIKVIVDTAIIGNDTISMCPGDSTQLTVWGCGVDAALSGVNWSHGLPNNDSVWVKPNTTTTYIASVTYEVLIASGYPYYTTTKSKNITVVVNPLPQQATISPALNPCDSTQTIDITNYDPNSTYVISLETGGSTYTTGVIGNLNNGMFNITYPPGSTTNGGSIKIITTNQYGCIDSTLIPFSTCCVRPGVTVLTNPKASDFPSGIISNSDYVINGTFTIDQDLQIINCKLYFAVGAKMIVAYNPTTLVDLDINNGTVLQSCDEVNMWEGIELHGQLHMSYSTIKEAKIGVDLFSTGTYQIDNSFLENNYIGIQIETAQRTNTADVKMFSTNIITNDTLLKPYSTITRGNYGIYLVQTKLINIDEEVVFNYNRNLIKNYEYGIMSWQSTGTINSTTFDSCNYGVYALESPWQVMPITYSKFTVGHTNPSTHKCEFKNNYCGIFAKHGVSVIVKNNTFSNNFAAISNRYQQENTELVVTGNYFDNCAYGVMALENVKQNIHILNNTFENTETNEGHCAVLIENVLAPSASWIPTKPATSSNYFEVIGNNIDLYKKGVQIKNMYSPYIQDNLITHVPANWNYATHGISLYNCPVASIKRNEVKGDNGNIWACHGISADFARDDTIQFNCIKSTGRALWIGGHSAGVKILNNHMSSSRTGIFTNWAYVGTQWDEIKSQGYWQTAPTDNMWVGSFVNHFYSNYSSAGNNFYLRAPGSTDYHPAQYRMPGFYSNVNSPSSNPTVMTPININNNELYRGQARCHNIGYTPPPNGDDFFDEEAVAIMADTSTLQIWNPDEVAQAWLRDQALYRELVQDTVNFTSNAVLNAFFNNVNGGDIGEIENIEELIQLAIENGSLQEFATAKAINTLLMGQEFPVQATQDFYNIYLPELEEGDGEYELNTNDVTTLKVLAQKCPYTHGTAVYQARALLRLAEESIVNFTSPCELGYQNGTAKTTGLPPDALNEFKELNPSFYLQPNPAKLYVKLNWLNFIPNSSTRIEIYNSLGELVFKKTVSNNELLIDLREFSSGIYFCSLIHKGSITQSEKLIIQ